MPLPTVLVHDVTRLDNRMMALEQEVARNRQADGEAVCFFNLGFRSKKESDAWLILNAPKEFFGYLVDFHTVMEHVHHQITGIDSLSSLGKLYKLKLSTISESLSMTSFETTEPRFLTASGSHCVINSESSYFSHITSFNQWNEPLEGFKKRWKQELINFRTSHTETIQNHLSPSSPIYSLALTSLTESVSWVLGLINYIDETYATYSNGKFGNKKAWHVSTKLATALIQDVGVPMRGVMNSFQAGAAQSINQVIFYATLRSLDRMALILSKSYRDAPAVSTELVKFLSMNTSVEAVDKLVDQSRDFQTTITTMTKTVASVSKDSGTIGNNVDKLKHEITELKKRLVKLE